MSRGPRRIAVALLVCLLVGAVGHGPAAALPLPNGIKGKATGLQCAEGTSRCTGFLAGGDGTALDVDLVTPGSGRYPLVVYLHGWGGNKGRGDPDLTYPGDAYFLDRGYAVVRYSARGFGKSWGQASLAGPREEVEDIRAVVSAIVDDGRFGVAPDRLAVVGASYGGGQAWMVAGSPAWTTPRGTPVRVATIVPVATWTNLASSLLPNGREDDPWSPVGSCKLSYLTSLYALGARRDAARLYPNYVQELGLFYTRALAGEPYQLGAARDPVVDKLSRFLQERSVTGTGWLDRVRDDPSVRTPVFAVQGWTDDLFPASEALRMVRSLERITPDYPVKLYLGDVGHPRAANKPEEVARVYELVTAWLAYWLKDEGARPSFDVTSATTTPGPFDPSLVASAPDADALSSSAVSTTFDRTVVLVNHPVQLGGLGADPPTGVASGLLPGLAELGALAPRGRGDIGGAAFTRPVDELAAGQPVWYQGRGAVTLEGTVVGTDAQYNVRLWDRDETGKAVLVDRGTTKYVGDPGKATIRVELFGNAWRFQPGHTLVVEVTNSDFPFLRPNNLPSSTVVEHTKLDLPVRAPVAAAASGIEGAEVRAGRMTTVPSAAGAQPAQPGPAATEAADAAVAAPVGPAAPSASAMTARDTAPPPSHPLAAALLAIPLVAGTVLAAGGRRRRSNAGG